LRGLDATALDTDERRAIGCPQRIDRKIDSRKGPGDRALPLFWGRPFHPSRPGARSASPKLAIIERDLKIRGYTVVEFPNPPLWVALAALLVARLADDGSVIDDLARAISYVALTVWAYEEAANGVNGFRKALGIAALVLIVVAVARAVG
jgi:hypothetical protein